MPELEKNKSRAVGFLKLFHYASCLDILLMLVGLVAAFLSGAAFPIAMNVFGDITNLFINQQVSRQIANSALDFCPSNPLNLIPVANTTSSIVDCASNYTVPGCVCPFGPEISPPSTPINISFTQDGLLELTTTFLNNSTLAFPINITNVSVIQQAFQQILDMELIQCPLDSQTSLTMSNTTSSNISQLINLVIPACTFTLPGLFPPNASLQCIDNIRFIEEINIQVYAFIAIAVGSFLFSWLHAWLFQTAAERQTHRIRLKYYHSVLRQDIGWFEENSSGEVSNRLSSGLDKIHKGIGDNISQLVQWVATFIAALAVGFYRQWELALLLCALIPFMAIAAALFSQLGSIFSNREEKLYSTAGGVATEVLSSIRTVFAFGGQRRECARYESNLAAATRQGVFKGTTTGFSVGLIYFLIFLVYSVSFWFGGFLVSEGRGEGGDVITVFFAILVGAFNLGQAGPNLLNLSEARGAAGEIYSTIERQPIIDSYSEEGLKPDNIECSIEFKEAEFSYPSRPDVQVLKNLSLKIDTGHTVALVGSSGSGKSTIIDLIQRFFDLSSGQLLIGGHDIKDLNLKWLRGQMGLVSQEPVLFDTTIAENIRFGKEDATLEEIQEAAKNANAHDFICSLPDGYDTQVGESGSQLSGGQKQRVAIARALIRNPKFLLLDEATSALDSESERVVQNALDGACVSLTTIVIAHRLSTIQNTDLIIVLDKGHVAETGTHSELLAKRGLYHHLVEARATALQPEVDRYKARNTRTSRSKSWRKNGIPRSIRTASRTLQLTAKTMRRLSRLSNRSSSSVSVSTDVSDSAASVEMAPIPQHEKSEEVKSKDVSSWQLIKNLPRRIWLVVLIGILASVLSGLVYPAFAIAFGEVLEVFGGRTDEILAGIHPWGATFLALGIFLAVCTFVKNLCFSVSGENLTQIIRSKLFRAILRQEVGWFDNEENSAAALSIKLSTNAGDISAAAGVRVGTMIEMLVTVLASVAVAFAYSWITTFVVVGLLPILTVGQVLYFAVAAGKRRSSNKGLKEASEIALESVRNIRTVSSFGLQERFYSAFVEEVQGIYKLSVCLSVLFGIGYGLSQSLVFYGYIITFRFGAYIVTLPTDNLLYTEFQNIFRVFAAIVFGSIAIGATASLAPDYSKAKQSAKIIYAIIDREPQIDNYSESGSKLENLNGEIKFNGVFFAYPQRLQLNVLSGMNLQVKQGQMLALVGASGGGKSTVMQLIERFYVPHAGSISLDGINILDINLSWLRSQIGIVSQEPILFDGTIADNIRYGALFREVSDEEVIAAAKSANIHEFIETLPMGYDTPIGSESTQLSGGQKQRVAIARALLRNPKILLLDEATSALDSESERVVQEALDKAREGRTCIVIAHRLSTIYNSDCIAVLKRGKVAELGTHQELMECKGLYYRLNKGSAGPKTLELP